MTNYRLGNLTPGTKYNITLAGATSKGEGPKATASVNTLPEKHQEIRMTSLSSIPLHVHKQNCDHPITQSIFLSFPIRSGLDFDPAVCSLFNLTIRHLDLHQVRDNYISSLQVEALFSTIQLLQEPKQ